MIWTTQIARPKTMAVTSADTWGSEAAAQAATSTASHAIQVRSGRRDSPARCATSGCRAADRAPETASTRPICAFDSPRASRKTLENATARQNADQKNALSTA